MSLIRCRLSAIVMVFASLLTAAGCVSVPTSGPVETVEGQEPGCQYCVNVEVAPPAPHAKPKEIVEGYLRATSYYQPNYAVARQYLSQMVAEKWMPEEGATIYSNWSLTGDENSIRLAGRRVGSLGRDRTYTAHDDVLRLDFHLAREKDSGEWRIDRLPPNGDGLLVNEDSFVRFYQNYNLYFIGNGQSLVPNPIYIPALRNPANAASALVKALLNGPSEWLSSAVSTAIPPNTGLSVDSVTITNGIAEVPLSDSVQPLQDEQRSLLAAQIVYTLRQVSGVKGVLIKVNQQPYRVPGSDPNSLVSSVDAIPQTMDPVSLGAGDLLYAVKDGAIKQVTASDLPTLQDLPKPVHGLPPVEALAVSLTNTDLALTTNKQTVLLHAVMTSEDQPNAAQSQSRTLLSGGVSKLLRPQFTRYGEIWEIGWEGGHQRMWMFDEKLKKIQINTPLLDDRVTAFRISPDGSRMALVRRTDGGGSELGLATIIRSDTIMVDHWLPVRTSQPSPGLSIASIRDVAWPNGTELLVLGAPVGAAYMPFRISQDAYEIAPQGSIQNANAVQLAVSPRRQTAIILGDKGRTWKDDGNQLSPFLNDTVSTITYPG